MSQKRKELKEALCRYITDTFTYCDTVRKFCKKLPQWKCGRETELTKMKNIKDEDELAAVLKDTLGGLKELDYFLDAVEKLAVTSRHVFMENRVFHLPKGTSLEEIHLVIIIARLICPLLLEFKRDASVFFLPKLQNVEVLSYQLEKYVQTTQRICDKFEKSQHPQTMTTKPPIDLCVDLTENDAKRMLSHINQLDKIRMDQNFRMVFLFQEVSCSGFISELNKRLPEMQKFLNQLEECAVQLDRMNKGAKISSVTGSSVGAVGGVLSIVGLALMPVTAGLSLGLLIGGGAMGLASGVNSAVTTATEIGVNSAQEKKAGEVFHSFMKDVQSVQAHLEEVTNQIVTKIEGSKLDVVFGVGTVLRKAGSVGVGIKSVVNNVRASEAWGNAVQKAITIGLIPRVASDIPDVGQGAVKGSLALSTTARAGFIGLNSLFLGMDIFFICKDSISLSKGSETKISQLIRARAALWSSEMDSWKKMHDSLCEGLKTSEKHRAVLKEPFYPE